MQTYLCTRTYLNFQTCIHHLFIFSTINRVNCNFSPCGENFWIFFGLFFAALQEQRLCLVFNDPHAIDYFAVFVIRYLFQVDMGFVVRLQSSVSIILGLVRGI